jgi:hypothetical protein
MRPPPLQTVSWDYPILKGWTIGSSWRNSCPFYPLSVRCWRGARIAAVLAVAAPMADARAGRGGSFAAAARKPSPRRLRRRPRQPRVPDRAQHDAAGPARRLTGAASGDDARRPKSFFKPSRASWAGRLHGRFCSAASLAPACLGMLFGHGIAAGLGGPLVASILGLILQVAHVGHRGAAHLVRGGKRRSQPAFARAARRHRTTAWVNASNPLLGPSSAAASAAAPAPRAIRNRDEVGLKRPTDFTHVRENPWAICKTAYGAEDLRNGLRHMLRTPEMVSLLLGRLGGECKQGRGRNASPTSKLCCNGDLARPGARAIPSTPPSRIRLLARSTRRSERNSGPCGWIAGRLRSPEVWNLPPARSGGQLAPVGDPGRRRKAQPVTQYSKWNGRAPAGHFRFGACCESGHGSLLVCPAGPGSCISGTRYRCAVGAMSRDWF